MKDIVVRGLIPDGADVTYTFRTLYNHGSYYDIVYLLAIAGF